jgi:hypothetical protein
MTIAVGLLCEEGVLLCTDTEETAWQAKSHASKIRSIELPTAKITFAYAGNTRFALSAITHCIRRLKSKNARDPLMELEEVLDREYRRNVLKHPHCNTDSSLHYQFLIGFWTPTQRPMLFITDLTAMQEVTDFDCIGIGEPLARHLIQPAHDRSMSYCTALPLAAYTLKLVKESTKDCDGWSIFTLLGNDGSVSSVTSIHPGPCSQMEAHAKGYQFLTTRILMRLADPCAEEEHVKTNIQLFYQDVLQIATEILNARKAEEKKLADINPHLSASQVKRLVVQLSMGLPLNPQPSPGSPGDSDVS